MRPLTKSEEWQPWCSGLDDSQLVTFVPMTCVSESSPDFDRSNERPLAEVRIGYTHFADGDVLFAKITPCMENGKGAVATGLKNGLGCGTTELHVIRPLGGIDPHYPNKLHLGSIGLTMAANHEHEFGATKMKKAEVKIGGKYYANVSGKRTEIQIESEKVSGGWNAINLATSKKIHIKTAQRLFRKERTKASTESIAAEVEPVAEAATTATTEVAVPKRLRKAKAIVSIIQAVRTLFAVGFAALGLFLLWGTYELSYLRDGQNAEAVITEIIWEGDSRKKGYVAHYSFKEATGVNRSGREQLSDWSTARVGDHLTVRYVPGIPGMERSGNLACVIIFVVIWCVIGISIVSAIWQAARQGHIFAVSWRPVLFGAMLGCGGISLVWLAETMFTVSRPYVYFWWFGTAGGAFIAAIREDFR